MNNKDKLIEDCRYYENEFPEEGSLVMCKNIETEDECSYEQVELLEYNKFQGLVVSECARRRKVRKWRKPQVGKEVARRIIRVDKYQGYIDLSKKDIKAEENKDIQEKYNNSVHVHNIMKSIAMKIGEVKLENLYTLFGWKLYKDYTHAIEAFKIIST